MELQEKLLLEMLHLKKLTSLKLKRSPVTVDTMDTIPMELDDQGDVAGALEAGY